MLLVIAGSFLLGLSPFEWALVLFCCAGTISLEMVNSSIEEAVNSITDHYKLSAKKAKDIAAGAALFFSFFAMIIGLIIFIPHIISLFTNIV